MLKKLVQIIKIAFGKGLPELPPREQWPIRFLLASDDAWALRAILNQIQKDPDKAYNELLPSGLTGMFLFRLWQHDLYENESWDKNQKCVKVSSSKFPVLGSKFQDNTVKPTSSLHSSEVHKQRDPLIGSQGRQSRDEPTKEVRTSSDVDPEVKKDS